MEQYKYRNIKLIVLLAKDSQETTEWINEYAEFTESKIYMKTQSLFSQYNDEGILLIHDLKPQFKNKAVSLDKLLAWTDTWKINVLTSKSTYKTANWHTVIVTTEKEPHRWWPSLPKQTLLKLLGRVDYIVLHPILQGFKNKDYLFRSVTSPDDLIRRVKRQRKELKLTLKLPVKQEAEVSLTEC